jgi:hypothetical protein
MLVTNDQRKALHLVDAGKLGREGRIYRPS